MYRKKLLVFVVVGLLVFGGGLLVGKLVFGSNSKSAQTTASKEDQYPLLARRLFQENPNDSIINFQPLRHSIETYFQSNNLKGTVYFEYLPTGTSIRVGQEKDLIAASLFKLPAAMDLYRVAELGRVDLNTSVPIKKEWLDNGYGNLYQRGEGYRITLRKATQIMLEESDNTALQIVSGSTPESTVSPHSFDALDVEFVENSDETVSIGAREYSLFLKCLYFSCYVNHEHSQEILDYLTQSQFNDRLVAGIPDKNIKIAHKIGVYNQDTQSDCGIVYVPHRNYVMCVMLKAPDTAQTSEHIANLSNMSYNFIKK